MIFSNKFIKFRPQKRGKLRENASYNIRFSTKLVWNFKFQSFGISQAVYSSDWTEMEAAEKRNLIMIVAKSQKPLFIQAFLFKANLENFTNVRKLLYRSQFLN